MTNHPHDTKLAGAIDEILDKHYHWVRADMGLLHQDEEDTIDITYDAKQAILDLLTSARSEATHQFILDMPDGVYNKKGRNLVMIDINTIPSRSDWVKEVVRKLPEKKQRKFVEENSPVTLDDEKKCRFYRYGGYDFAIDEVTKLLKGVSDEYTRN